jgi:hypothetical protein
MAAETVRITASLFSETLSQFLYESIQEQIVASIIVSQACPHIVAYVSAQRRCDSLAIDAVGFRKVRGNGHLHTGHLNPLM